MLRQALAGSMRGEAPGLPSAGVPALGLGLLLAVLAGWLTLLAARGPSAREPGLRPSLDEIPGAQRGLLCVVALALALAGLRAGLAAAARAVDAPLAPEPVLRLWSSWGLRALVVLACAVACLGVIERLASARRLWQGLHLTPAQARERARALGHRGK